MEIDLKNLTIEKAHNHLKNGDFKVSDLVYAYLKNIQEKNNELNAFIEVFNDIDEQVEIAQKKFTDGTATLLTGIPTALKDNILFKGHIASASSKILENYTATYDSFVVSILKKEGAVILGRTNMDEFAMGSSTETSYYGISKNPFDTSRVPGGSSGGSAISVASNMSLFSLGTDTCGSVREPSSFCGLVGLKPTYGALSRNGIIAMGNSLDQVAPFTKNVSDSEIVFNALSKYDKEDATSVPEDLRKPKNIFKNNKIIGVPWHLLDEGVDPVVLDNFKESLKKMEGLGYQIKDIKLPHAKYSLAVYYIIMPAEVSTNLSRFDGIRYGLSKDGEDTKESFRLTRSEGFGKETRRRIILGTYVLSHGYYDAYYNKAKMVRKIISQEIEKVLEEVDFIATPTVPVLPFKIGEKVADPVAMYLCDIFSAPANLTGIPAIALPSGKTEDGLPMSIQFMAPHFCEDRLFSVGKDFEKI